MDCSIENKSTKEAEVSKLLKRTFMFLLVLNMVFSSVYSFGEGFIVRAEGEKPKQKIFWHTIR